MRKNILITGDPKSGKSTLLEKLIVNYPNRIGFITREISKDNMRRGFEMLSHDGQKVILADIDNTSTRKVGRYFVHLEKIDPFLLRIQPSDTIGLLYMDEIGQMQLFSNYFKKMVHQFLDSPSVCVATITSVYEDSFISNIKNRDDVIVVKITPEDREEKLEFVKMLIKKIEKSRRYVTEPERFERGQPI